MRLTFLSVICSLVCISAGAQEEIKPFLETTDFRFEEAFYSIKNPEEVFNTDGSWFPYPEYTDRAGWDNISVQFKKQIIAAGEKYLNHTWNFITASKYIEYETTGNRKIFTKEENDRKALNALALAELVEGEGRFLSQIVDGMWFYAIKWSWSHPQHTRYQTSRRALPTYDERPITYHSSATAASVAIVWHFFHKEFDKLDPSISIAVMDAMERNIFTPYMDKNHRGHGWMGFSPERKTINNHTTNENFNCILCFMLMKKDQEKLIAAMQRSVEIQDKYMSYIKHDGACEEGSAYWKASFGKMYQYCRIMYDFSDGKINLLSDPLIRKMGEFKANAYLGGGYHMNYGDGAVRDYVSPALLYNFGKDTGSKMLKNFGLFMMVEQSDKFDNRNLPNKASDLHLSLEIIRYGNMMADDQKMALENAGNDFNVLRRQLVDMRSVWYPETEYAIMRNGSGWVLAAKGAANNESHNHNDVGSGMLYINSIPVIIDPGIGTYNKNTFGPNRYKEWEMRSEWHNLPVINGQVQMYGAEYKAENTLCDIRRNTLSTEIQKAYPDSAFCQKWQRQYLLTGSAMKIADNFILTERTCPDIINFIVRGDVEISDKHIIITAYSHDKKTSLKVKLSYSPTLTPKVEEKVFNSSKHEQRWNCKSLKRISFTSAADAPLIGTYEFVFTAN